MNEYHLLNGRKIFLVRWNLVRTYNDFYEGTKKGASKYIREELPEIAAKLMRPGYPLVIIGSPGDELPIWLCMAEFRSKSSVHNNGPNFNSELYVCWFMEDTYRSLDEIIMSIIPQIEWDTFAKDYDVMNS